MEQSENNPGPIAEEPAVLTHIGYAIDLIDMVIRNSHYEIDIEDLIKVQHHLINAKWSVPRVSYHEGAVTISTVEWKDEDAPSIADELEDADLEGWN